MTDPFYRQDIFFFVTTIAVVVVGLLLAILTAYLISIFKDIKRITAEARRQTDLLAEDIQAIREDVKARGFGWKTVGKLFSKIYSKRAK